MAKQQGPTKEQAKILERYADIASKLEISSERRAAINKQIEKSEIATVKELDQALVKAERLTLVAAKRKKDAEDQAKEEERIREAKQGQIDLAEDLGKRTDKILKANNDILNVSRDQVKAAQEEIKADIAHIKYQIQTGQLTGAALKQAQLNLDTLEKQSAQYDRIQTALDSDSYKKVKNSMDATTKAAEEFGDKLEEAFSKIPGGAFLGKVLGLDDAKKKLTDGVVAGFKNMNAEMLKGKGTMAGLKAGAKGFNAVLAVNPLVLIAAAAAGLFMMMKDVEKKAQEFSASTGLDVAQSKELVKEVEERGIMTDNVLAKNEDIIKVQEEMIKRMGTAGKLSVEMATNVAETAKMFGYSADQAAGVQESFEVLGATSAEAAEMQRDLGLEAFKSGVNVGAVMKDISENSEDAMRYIGGGAKEMAKAALEGAKMGMDLKQMTKVADKLLDIESSLTAQFEFQALSGREINLDKARELALSGDIVGASKAVVEQVGSAAEFNKMSRFEKEKLAEATGMEVGELAKTLTLQEKLGDLSDEQAAAAKSLGLSAEEMQKMSKEDLEDAIKKQQSAEKAGKAFEDLVTTLKTALMPIAEIVTDVLGTIAPILTYALWPVQMLAKGLKTILEFLGPMKIVLGIIAGYYLMKYIRGRMAAKQQKKTAEQLIQQNQYEEALEKIAARRAKSEKQTADAIKDQGKAMADNKKAAQEAPGGRRGIRDRIKGGVGKLKNIAKNPLAIAGAGVAAFGAYQSYQEAQQVGDLSIDPNGGPVVSSPREGGVYQGTKNDGVSMSPAHGGGGGGGIDYDKMTQAFIAAMQQMPAPQVNMDGAKVSESVSAQQSYDRGIK